MRLVDLVEGLEASIFGEKNVSIRGIAYDSRQVKPGFVFVAITGFKMDGHDFIEQAVQNGAVAVVVGKNGKRDDVTVVQVTDSRRALAVLSANFYQHPSRQLKVYAVTGTNGKTTTCHLLREIFRKQGCTAGVLGTIGNWLGDKKLAAVRTTPESLEIQGIFRRMVDEGVTHAVMEVSSHALELHRVDQIDFRGAIFTNLSQDHLDFHPDLQSYLHAKGKLFARLAGDAHGVVNMDDVNSFPYLQKVSPVPLITYGRHPDAAVRAVNIHLGSDGVKFDIAYKDTVFSVNLETPGLFTVYNATAAAAVALAEGIAPAVISSALKTVKGVAGRFQRVDCGQDFTVIVDYAHTPDSLENILTAAREFVSGRLITVFGCGGDRDRGKRPLMGEVAAKISDYTVVTSDNPRSEEPGDIIEDILPGVKKHTREYTVIVDRRDAIAYALSVAAKGDMVIIAGKGHETYQEVKGKTYPFDDREVAKEILRGRHGC